MRMNRTPADAVRLAAEIVGGLSALGVAIGIDPSKAKATVWAWTDRNSVPVEHCAAIEAATNGAVARWHLRPHDWRRIWPELEAHPKAPKTKSTRKGAPA